MKRLILISGYTLVILGAASMLLPFIWMICVSFMTDTQIFAQTVSFIPHPFISSNYTDVFSRIPVMKFFINSLFVAIITTFFQVLFSAMAGYAFARAKFKWINILFFVFLISMMIPPQVNIIPLFFIMRELHWIDTYNALIIPGLFGGLGVFMMRQWFKNISQEIEDAAQIDGCDIYQVFFKIAIPTALPVLITLGLFTFVTTWNSFMWPLIVTQTPSVTTLPVALAQFKGSFREIILWGDLMACSVVLTIPAIIVFLLGKKYFINDILSGGLKE